MYKHLDGNISIHVYIGATGVNNVDVDISGGEKFRGDRIGDMKPGKDKYKAYNDRPAVKQKQNREGLPKLRIGEKAGNFPLNGSTIIHFFLGTDFQPLPEISEFQDNAIYGEGKKRNQLEFRTQMGNPILVKTEIAIYDAIERWNRQDKIYESHDKRLINMFLSIQAKGDSRTPDEERLYQKIMELVKKNSLTLPINHSL
ncbi:MAG: hypothetical protein Tsb0021_13990 [Chlamydiales bacterium]